MKHQGVTSAICFVIACMFSCGTIARSSTVFSQKDAAGLFGVDHVPQFEFTLPEDQWQWLQANARKEQYVKAQASYEGQAAGTIGLRFKGSIGTLANCFDHTGKLICAKLSFSVDFEKYDSSNRFFGLKRLNLHSMVNDPTKLHERIAYDLYQLNGIKAPRSSWANVKVNGKSYGLFSMVEVVDDRFTADRWPGNGNGNLYKEVWPKTNKSTYYDRGLKTKGDAGNHEAMIAFAGDLANSNSANLTATLGKWTDLSYMDRYMAVDDAIANCDGITAMYSADATTPIWNNHNYYFYQEPNRHFFWLIPWDMDATLTPCFSFAAVPHWNRPPEHCGRNYPVWGHTWVKEPGCDRLLQAVAMDRAGYQAAVDHLLAGPFREQTVLDKIDLWAKFIHDSEVADPTAQGEASWVSAVKDLKGAIPLLRERLLAIRDAQLAAPLSLSLTANNDFESATSLGARLAFVTHANINSEATQEVKTAGALDGNRNIRLNFVIRDPSGTSKQGGHWIYYFMPFTNGCVDLTSMRHMRLLMRTDQPRTVRIELESDLYQEPGRGIRFGWEVAVTNSTTPIDLAFENASVPSWAKETKDTLSHTLTCVRGVIFNPFVAGQNVSGDLGADKSDSGSLEIDDIQFLPQ